MNHKVIANLIAPKIPTGQFMDVDFIRNENVRHDPIPRIRISEDKECEMQYTQVEDAEIKSPYYMSTVVSADNETLIEDQAEKKFSLVINNLSFLQNDFWGEYRIIKIDTLIRGEWRTVWSIFSKATRLSISHNPSHLESEEADKLKKALNISDKIYRKSLHYLGEGEKRLNRDLIKGEDRVNVETFLNLFKPIELISNEVCKKTSGNIPNGAVIRFFVNLFRFGKEKAIEKILEAYKVAKVQSTREKIEQTGKVFKIDGTSISKIIEYYRYRNRLDIAHAHKSFPNEKIDYSELSGFSRNFIKKYLDHKNLLVG